MPFRPEKLSEFPTFDQEHFELASKIYGSQGYCLIKNFLTPTEVSHFKEKFLADDSYSRSTGHVSYRYMYKNNPGQRDQDFYQLVRKVIHKRNLIALQPNSDLFTLDYCNRHSLDPRDMDKLIDQQLNHTYFRATKHGDQDYFPTHYDYPGEIQCIIPLTKKGVDFDQGGLHFNKTETQELLDLESLTNPGDLVIINGYKKLHYVEPITCSSNSQNGRITLFIPVIPEYVMPNYYFFKNNKLKIFFTTPKRKHEKMKYYILHFLRMLLGKSKALDEV